MFHSVYIPSYSSEEADKFIEEKTSFWEPTTQGLRELVATNKRPHHYPRLPPQEGIVGERWEILDSRCKSGAKVINPFYAFPNKQKATEVALELVAAALAQKEKDRLALVENIQKLIATQERLLAEAAEIRLQAREPKLTE